AGAHDEPDPDGVSKARLKLLRKQNTAGRGRLVGEHEFRCVHCHTPVSTDPRLSGVNNRNHCPYCLWSRHLDLRVAGDRLSACKEPMRPVGLTIKRTLKKYGNQGELMLVHLCSGCGKISLNRIAADDLAYAINTVFERSLNLEKQLLAHLENAGISPLNHADAHLIARQLDIGLEE
ncbi:MAG TPA: RNHCP domain-containing protein, partial [Anaerolineaceae bacterium]|nr:RNHCP domain-containing protein [Anaerolineaceae bacterium]